MSKQKFIDETLQLSLHRIAEEASALLGMDFNCTPHQGRFATTADYLATRTGPAALACMAISGEKDSAAHLIVPLSSAILLGASLILLPTEEIASRRKKLLFDGDVADAFGEIANILAGVYTAVFLEKFSRKTHFKKTSVAPLATATGAPPEQSLTEEQFYISQTGISLGGDALGNMEILIPCDILGLTPPASTQAAAGQAAAAQPQQPAVAEGPGQSRAGGSQPPATPHPAEPTRPGLILIMTDQAGEGEQLAAPLRQGGFETRIMALQESIREASEGRRVAGVFVLLREVADRQLASLIKAQSALGTKVPLVVGGGGWTRNAVLQAVKYGARDILVTPAEPDEILAKARAHMAK
jgi:hypothetical protein